MSAPSDLTPHVVGRRPCTRAGEDRHPRRPREGTGFTLTELLVVIGILAVLMSILMPSLSRARQQAQAIQCATNLRTIATAWMLYANSNGRVSCPGRLPTKGSPDVTPTGAYYLGESSQYRPRWYELLGEKVNIYPCKNPKNIEDDSWTVENPVFLCGAVPNWTNSRNYPYGYNYQFLGNARPRADGKWINWPVKADRINGAQTVMAADCIGTAAGKGRTERQGYYSDGTHDRWAVGNKGWALDPPRLLPDSDYADPEARQPKHRSGPDFRHNKRACVAFCDGHVEFMLPGEMGYVENPDGSLAVSGQNANGLRADNRLFSGTGRDDDPPPVR